NVEEWHVECGTVAQVLALPPHSKKVMGLIPAWVAVGSGGQVLQCSGGLSPGPFCVEFACSPSVHKNPNSTLSYQSLTKMDGSLHLVSGRLKAALGSWRKDNPGWGNAEVKFTAIVDITRLYTNENHLGTPYSSQLSWKYKELFSWC